MNNLLETRFGVCAFAVDYRVPAMLRTFLVLVLFIPILCLTAFANPEITTSEDQTTVIVNDAPEQDVISFGKSVIVIKRAKGVLVVGGDITVEGRVEGDVATIGGNIVQKENAYIGGEVIAIGGSYKPESTSPLREAGNRRSSWVFSKKNYAVSDRIRAVFLPRVFRSGFWHSGSLSPSCGL
ncbi:MAG: hypothetical protein IPG22_18185 [Acidobacteria bacterium]|nr:hypothetical protein [Acidobacteriota bacterium]